MGIIHTVSNLTVGSAECSWFWKGIESANNHFLGHGYDPNVLHFPGTDEGKVGVLQGQPQVIAVKAVAMRMDEDPPRDKILIECRVNLFQEIEAAGLQHPGHFLEPRAPIRDMVEHTEAENRVHRAGGIRQGKLVSGAEVNRVSFFCRKIASCLAHHLNVEIRGMKLARFEMPDGQAGVGVGAGPPTRLTVS